MAALVLAPHPDDFDAMGVTLRHFRDRGHDIRLLVLSSSANGVEDSLLRSADAGGQGRASRGRTAGELPVFRASGRPLEFLRLARGCARRVFLIDHADSLSPAGRVRRLSPRTSSSCPTATTPIPTTAWLIAGGEAGPRDAAAGRGLLVRDPKTIAMRDDLFVPFDENAAAWKAELLRFHRSQHQRNLNTRGHGFDERILRVNRDNAARLGIAEPYAESFEIDASLSESFRPMPQAGSEGEGQSGEERGSPGRR